MRIVHSHWFLRGFNVFCLYACKCVAYDEINWMLRNRQVWEITQRSAEYMCVNEFRLHDFVYEQRLKWRVMFKNEETERKKPFTPIFVSIKHDRTNKRLSCVENKRRWIPAIHMLICFIDDLIITLQQVLFLRFKLLLFFFAFVF